MHRAVALWPLPKCTSAAFSIAADKDQLMCRKPQCTNPAQQLEDHMLTQRWRKPAVHRKVAPESEVAFFLSLAAAVSRREASGTMALRPEGYQVIVMHQTGHNHSWSRVLATKGADNQAGNAQQSAANEVCPTGA